jgi:hypothetical protein
VVDVFHRFKCICNNTIFSSASRFFFFPSIDLIAINQDPLGIPVNNTMPQICTDTGSQPPRVTVWAGPLANGDFVLMLLNVQSDNACTQASVNIADALAGMPGTVKHVKGTTFDCRDLWSNSSCGTFLLTGGKNLTIPVDKHQAIVMRFSAADDASRNAETPTDVVREDIVDRHESLPFWQGREGDAAQDQYRHVQSHLATGSRRKASTTAPAPWPTRGGDASHSGRSRAGLKGPSTCAQKWSFTPDHQHTKPTYEVSDAVWSYSILWQRR